jgi:predicted phage terminase large subunit-like protein
MFDSRPKTTPNKDPVGRRLGLDQHLFSIGPKKSINTNKLPSISAIQEAKIDRSLYHFMAAAWDKVEKGKFMGGWHLEAIAEHLEAVFKGQIKRLIINIPPRTGKSLVVGVFWPSWIWAQRPETRMIYAAHAQQLSTRDSVTMRRLIESAWYLNRYPHVRLEKDQNAKTYYQNTAFGMRMATSVGSAITGEGGDILTVDDPLNAKEALTSEVTRQEAIDWWNGTMSTRLNPGTPIGSKLIIMQRLHENDLSGFLLRKRDEYVKAIAEARAMGMSDEELAQNPDTNIDLEDIEYDHLCLPANYSDTHPFKSKTKLHFVDPRKQQGELLWEAGLPQSKINLLRAELGAAGAAGQLQQMPTPEGGGQLKGKWFRRLSKEEWPKGFEQIIQCWDLSYSDDPEADYTVGFALGRVGTNVYIKRRIRRQLAFTDQIKALETMSTLEPEAAAKYIEQAANAKALHNTVQNSIPGIILRKPTDSKEARAWAWSPYLEAGNIFVPDWEPWVEELIHECEQFPNGTYDDQVDALGLGVLEFLQHKTYEPVLDEEFGRRELDTAWSDM